MRNYIFNRTQIYIINQCSYICGMPNYMITEKGEKIKDARGDVDRYKNEHYEVGGRIN